MLLTIEYRQQTVLTGVEMSVKVILSFQFDGKTNAGKDFSGIANQCILFYT